MKLSMVTIGAFVEILLVATKYVANDVMKKDITTLIPVFAVVYGVILALIGYFSPDIYMGTDILEALMFGGTTGAACTGVHQAIKQQTKKKSTKKKSTKTKDPPVSEKSEEKN